MARIPVNKDLDSLYQMKYNSAKAYSDISVGSEVARNKESIDVIEKTIAKAGNFFVAHVNRAEKLATVAKFNQLKNMVSDQLSARPDLMNPDVFKTMEQGIKEDTEVIARNYRGFDRKDLENDLLNTQAVLTNRLHQQRREQIAKYEDDNAMTILSAYNQRFNDFETVIQSKSGQEAYHALVYRHGAKWTADYIQNERMKSVKNAIYATDLPDEDSYAYMTNVMNMGEGQAREIIDQKNREFAKSAEVKTTNMAELARTNTIGYSVASAVMRNFKANPSQGLDKVAQDELTRIDNDSTLSYMEKSIRINALTSYVARAKKQLDNNTLDFLSDSGTLLPSGFTHRNPKNKTASIIESAIETGKYTSDGHFNIFNTETMNGIKQGNMAYVPLLQELKQELTTYQGRGREGLITAFDKTMLEANPLVAGAVLAGDDTMTILKVEDNLQDLKGGSPYLVLDKIVKDNENLIQRNPLPGVHFQADENIGLIQSGREKEKAKRQAELYRNDINFRNLMVYEFAQGYKNGEHQGVTDLPSLASQAGVRFLQRKGAPSSEKMLWTTNKTLTYNDLMSSLIYQYTHPNEELLKTPLEREARAVNKQAPLLKWQEEHSFKGTVKRMKKFYEENIIFPEMEKAGRLGDDFTNHYVIKQESPNTFVLGRDSVLSREFVPLRNPLNHKEARIVVE